MVAQARRAYLNLPLAPTLGGAFGVVVAAAIVMIPRATLEDFLLASGVPSVFPIFEPPLGPADRLALTMLVACVFGALAWFLLFLGFGSRMLVFGQAPTADASVPVLRRADAHPDAPARRPLFANQDLGTPFLEISAPRNADEEAADAEAEILEVAAAPQPPAAMAADDGVDIPDDLDTPLADFDPGAIAVVPILRETPVAALASTPIHRPQLFDPGERFETFELTPMVRPEPETAPATPRLAQDTPRRDTEATVAALLERLERSVAVRETPRPDHQAAPGHSIDQTLGVLRELATRVG